MADTNLSRNTPLGVQRILRKEVNYGCPVPECGEPLLTWHHFDPPWKIEEHHDPDRMIALCLKHHGLAEGEEYSREQLREWKQNPNNPELLKKEYDWMFPWCLIRLGGGVLAPGWCDLRIEDFVVFQAKRTSADHLAFSFKLKNEDDALIASMEDNMFRVFPELVHDFSLASRGNRIKIWLGERKVGFEFRFSRISLDDIEEKIKPLVGEPLEPIENLEAFYRKIAQIDMHNDPESFARFLRSQPSMAVGGIRLHVSKFVSQHLTPDKKMPFLDLISARFHHAGRTIEMRKGKLTAGETTLESCVGNTFCL